ncbi:MULTISPECIES: DUF4256 domain-containing protein [unclassified Jeotgalibaca]|uniref:DUF4256 domain-containing protein n=1 Tax=unclassified Jeotgalibaca TaxID=2621505 RepID=UPI003FD42FF6
MNKDTLFETLKTRFEENMHRHENTKWVDVKKHLEASPDAIKSLIAMEETGGEPDIVGDDFTFVDCVKETPAGRRNTCYDRAAWEKRKKNKPETDAMTMAEEMGIEMLTEEEYRKLQTYEEFDVKTSTWVKTPEHIRNKGGAIFCDRRYDTVFTYHNGADSYYSSRGFRGKITI